jgi:uncharacterized damage-inducible protein DinB
MSEVALLLDLLDEAYDEKSWHGPNLRSAIRGASAEQAAWRPAPQNHNIWQLTLHAAYWKYVARRRLTGEGRGKFPIPGSNFFRRPVDPSEAAWKADIAILQSEHIKLREVVKRVSAGGKTPEQWRDALHTVRGVAAHDLYHAGQIRLLRRLREK